MNTRGFSRILLVLAIGANACRRTEALDPVAPGNYQRVVALAPSLSETLFALGLGDRVVGVAEYARYPSEVQRLPRIGGYTDISIEAVYALRPDLVLGLDQQDESARRLQSLGLKVALFENTSIDDILVMIRGVGDLFGHAVRAAGICDEIERHRTRLRDSSKGHPSPRVLISVGRNMGGGSIGDVYAAGPATLFGEIIALTGACNVYEGPAPYAALGREAVLRLNPDVIIDLIPDMDTLASYTQTAALREWDSFASVAAVQNRRVSVHVADYICIPGPRVTLMMNDIARAIHPAPAFAETGP